MIKFILSGITALLWCIIALFAVIGMIFAAPFLVFIAIWSYLYSKPRIFY